ncbi:MAG: hypothetical protein EPO21_22000 [Chloroflexota bacterium]|nr:MAG: hypothetical protein EPO21_22000 [Chloroflexota bacterium]
MTKTEELEDRLTPREQQSLRLAKHQRYLVVRPRAKQDVEEAYRLWCRQSKVPFVRVRKLRHFAEVSLEFETAGREAGPEASEKAKDALQRYSWAPYTYRWTSKLWSTSRVPLEMAEKLAETLFEIATT